MRENISRRSTCLARAMRHEQTDAEKALWRALRDRRLQGVKFRRQVPVGPYIVDFLCLKHRLVIEADGSQHAENARDARRDSYLATHGFSVLRFWNGDILNQRESVLATIAARCGLPW